MSERRAFLGGKWRHVYRAPLADTVVLFVLAGALTEIVAPLVSERVYSYRKGRSSRQAVRDLAGFVKAHRRAVPDVRARGLHVLRRDVSSYGDSIPVGETSPLWPLLRSGFARAGHAPDDDFSRLVERALRPRVIRLDGTLEAASRGVPMGSPLQPAVCNLYLDALDRRLESIPGGFYARFGDDFVFAHPELAAARQASDAVTTSLEELDLTLNRDKVRDLFWSGAGRRPAVLLSELARGTTHVEYLGLRVAFDGTTTPSQRKLARLRSELRSRIFASERLLRDVPLAERVRALAEATNHALEPRNEAALLDAVELFLDGSDRKKLAELDHWLARTLAEALTGTRGARAFRSAPPRFLREHGLLSLVGRRRRRGAA
ncbi:MAG TPA: reverse transcriptase domain-containing protein [Polyangiaceae bacterium]|nr:reverse transcriptase domain-containing protein [Polyangiaceae bacterium]